MQISQVYLRPTDIFIEAGNKNVTLGPQFVKKLA